MMTTCAIQNHYVDDRRLLDINFCEIKRWSFTCIMCLRNLSSSLFTCSRDRLCREMLDGPVTGSKNEYKYCMEIEDVSKNGNGKKTRVSDYHLPIH